MIVLGQFDIIIHLSVVRQHRQFSVEVEGGGGFGGIFVAIMPGIINAACIAVQGTAMTLHVLPCKELPRHGALHEHEK